MLEEGARILPETAHSSRAGCDTPSGWHAPPSGPTQPTDSWEESQGLPEEWMQSFCVSATSGRKAETLELCVR